MGLLSRFCLVCLLLLPSASVAQTRARKKTPTPKAPGMGTPMARWPIQKISIEGNERLSAEQIVPVTGLRIGQIAGKEDFEAARDRLIATGVFESVGYQFAPSPKGQGYDASFQLIEVKQVYPVRFEALAVPDAAIAAYLKSKNPLYGSELPGTKPVLDQFARQIETFMAERNRPDKVVGELVATGVNQFEILFRSATALPAIAEVTFEGNEAVPGTALEHAISGVAFGVPFTKRGFQQLLDTQIRPLYEAKGRVRVSFPKVTTEPSAKVKGVIVHVVVDEGVVYKLGKVSVNGAPSSESASLLKTAAIKTDEVANFDEVNQGLDRIKKSMRRNGYVRVDGEIDRKIDDAKKLIDIAIKIDPGPQFHFGKLTIEGLDLIGEPAVRKLWSMKPGQPFDADYPNRFLDRVREDGMFDGLGETKASTDINDNNHTVNVTLKFGASPPVKDERRRRTGAN